jgi:uncharacterized protein (UPF0335 family)
MSEPHSEQLRLLIERIERLNEDKKGISDDIRGVYNEAKAHGYDNKIVRAVIRLRAMESNERAEYQTILDTYMTALGL